MKCPYCQEDIKKGALKCRYCGEFLDGHSSKDQKVETVYHDGGMSGGTLFGIIVAAIVVGGIVLVIG